MQGRNYLTAGYSVRSWLLSTDHKRVGLLYLCAVTLFFFVGGFAALLMRLQLLTPAGSLVQAETYNKLFTMHGVTMVFLFLIPAIPGVLGNFLIPMMVGSRGLAFPRLNLASWHIFMAGGFLILATMAFGGVDTGWTLYMPFSSLYSNTPAAAMAAGIGVVGLSSLFSAVNFFVTIQRRRVPGLGWSRLPLFAWSMYIMSAVLILEAPILLAALAGGIAEKVFHPGALGRWFGANPLYFERLFWLYAHPVVYAMILPAMGVISEIIPCFSKKRLFAYWWMVGSMASFAVLCFLSWGEHLFVAGQSVYAGLVFSFFSFMMVVPCLVSVFGWVATLYKGRIYLSTPMIYALGFVGLFVFGGSTGAILASLGLNVHLHDTYFVVAHFHYIMVGGVAIAYLGGLHFWWPKITGRLYPEFWGKISAMLIFVGFNLTFLPQFILGYLGMPRRAYHYPPEFQVLHVFSTAGASILGVSYLLPLIYLVLSVWRGSPSGSNPWGAAGLEWKTPSPPPPENFAGIPSASDL